MRGKIIYAGILAVTVYLNLLYHWELGNLVLAFEGMFLLLLFGSAVVSWFGVSAEWKHTKLFLEEGEEIQNQIFVRNCLFFPICKVRIDLCYQYCGEEKKRKERLWTVVNAKEKKQISVSSFQKYSGRGSAELVSCRVYDVLGIWSFRKRINKKAELLIVPKPYPIVMEVTAQTRNFPLESERFSEEMSGEDPSEVFALHRYQPGDQIARVHWKLSARQGEWYVKEFGRPVGSAVLLLLEPVWKAERADAKKISMYLQTAVSLVRGLLDAECDHVVSWTSESGELQRMQIFNEEDFYLFAIRFLETWEAGMQSDRYLTEHYQMSYPQDRYHTIFSWCGEGGLFKNEEVIFDGQWMEIQEWFGRCQLEV